MKVNARSISTEIKIAAPDIEKLLEEDAIADTNKLLRVSFPINITADCNTTGNWITLKDGAKIWQLLISSNEAVALNVSFNKFWLPNGGKLYVYNKETTENIGAITNEYINGDKNNPESFIIAPIKGDKIIIEYFQPATTDESPIISIDKIYYTYKFIYKEDDPYWNAAGSCHINPECDSNYTTWRTIGDATTRIIIHTPRGGFLGSGCLINNTAADGTPYVLTANHCLDDYYDAKTNNNASNMIFHWGYKEVDCGKRQDSEQWSSEPSTVGATIVANNSNSDFALLKLTQNPIAIKKQIYLLGWDRSVLNTFPSGVCLHHPKGSYRRISEYTKNIVSTDYLKESTKTSATHWKVKWSTGVTEGGSSGSPLILNSTKRIIGQLHGGYSSCNNPTGYDWFGKFSSSWHGTDPKRCLKPWLDPYNINPLVLDSYTLSSDNKKNRNDETIEHLYKISKISENTISIKQIKKEHENKTQTIKYTLIDGQSGIKYKDGYINTEETHIPVNTLQRGKYILIIFEGDKTLSYKINI